MKKYDFRKPAKTWGIILPNGKELTLKLPSKSLLDDIMNLSSMLTDTPDPVILDKVYRIAATMISNNTQCIAISPQKTAELFDFAELYNFFALYVQFVNEAVSEKNSPSRTILKKTTVRENSI